MKSFLNATVKELLTLIDIYHS